MLINRFTLTVGTALTISLVAELSAKDSPAQDAQPSFSPNQPAPQTAASPSAPSDSKGGSAKIEVKTTEPTSGQLASNRSPAPTVPMAGKTAASVAVASKTPPTEPAPSPKTDANAQLQAVASVEASKPAPQALSIDQLVAETNRMNAEKEKLLAELALAQARLDSELAQTKQNTDRINAQLAELKAKQELADFAEKNATHQSLAKLRSELEKATLASNLAKAKVETELAEIKQLENVLKKDTTKLAAAMELEEKQAEARNFANNEPIYLENPLQDNRLVLSDRRIPLNGVITMKTADDVVDRINYFNNRDRKMPIFIVIDDSPGGSVMAGYKILKSMKGSQAPVYVVVRSFAASMAACITTLAEKSFAYPNAVILHHQISSFSGGNLTQQQEWVREMQEWWKRLAGPVADKMGITREEFIKRMYEHSSSGDWNEFADQAQKLNWVDVVVEEIEETGTLRLPGKTSQDTVTRRTSASPHTHAVAGPEPLETMDAKGRPSMVLPRLNPFDCYWLYNPDGYYKVP